jgi:hypothetical protein
MLLPADGGLRSRYFNGKMFEQPPVYALLLAGVNNSLPTDVACPVVIFGDYILGGGEVGDHSLRPKPATEIRVVNYAAIFHKTPVYHIYDTP